MARCPRCGFELSADGLCPVCHYSDDAGQAGTGAGSSPRDETGSKRGPGRPHLSTALLIVMLCVSCGAGFIMGLVYTRGGNHPLQDQRISAMEHESTALPAENPAGAPEGESLGGGSAGEAFPVAPDDGTGMPAFDVRSRDAHPSLDDKEAYVRWMLAHTSEEEKYVRERWDRAQIIIQMGYLKNDRTIEGFLRTPREYFCRERNLDSVYTFHALAIGYGQTISGPNLVSNMTENLNLLPEHKVLEIGTGSGYQSAFLSELSNHVYTIEIVKPLADETDAIYRKHEQLYPEYGNIQRVNADGYYGWEEHAPFDRIIVTCGIDHIPPPLLSQLAPGGIMVIPVGPPSGQTVLKITKKVADDGTVSLDREDIYHGKREGGVKFVPFTSDEGGIHSMSTETVK